MEVMKATGKPTAITMCIGPPGDTNNVPPGECAVRLARKGNVDCLVHRSCLFRTSSLLKLRTQSDGEGDGNEYVADE